MLTLLLISLLGATSTRPAVAGQSASSTAENRTTCTSPARSHVDVARLLLDKGAEVDRANKDGTTPLYVAGHNGHVAAVRLLLDNGADINRADKDGETPLHGVCDHYSCDNSHIEAGFCWRMVLMSTGRITKAKRRRPLRRVGGTQSSRWLTCMLWLRPATPTRWRGSSTARGGREGKRVGRNAAVRRLF